MKMIKGFYGMIILLLSVTADAQVLSFTKTADKFFTSEEYKSLIKKAAIDAASDQDIPASVVSENYAEYQVIIESISRPLILKKFRWLEDGMFTKPVKGTAAYDKGKDAYTRELQRGVRDALLANRVFLDRMRSIDQTDRILSFNSDVTIYKTGMYTVVETIRVYNGSGSNDEIKRGIKRSFPTRYTNSIGFVSTVPFRIKKVLKNGIVEPYHTEKASNGIVLYAGSSDVILRDGIYTYEISYETDRQLIYHTDKDECYWNVTGNDWSFSCEKASCTIHFPEEATILEKQCYTGSQGATQHECNFDSSTGNAIRLRSTKPLLPYEGLTFAVSIQKGIIQQPSAASTTMALLRDNIIVPILCFFVLLYFFLNFRAWWRMGRDPKRGTIFPQFEPPANLSPADAGYLLKQHYTSNLFAASLVDHAVNHLVDIEVQKEGIIFKSPAYYFHAPKNPNKDEAATRKRYEWYGYDIHDLYGLKAEKGKYNSGLAAIYNRLGRKLEERMLVKKGTKNTFKGLFSLNNNWAGPGIFFLVFIVIGTAIYLGVNHSKGLVITSIILIIILIIIQAIFMKIMSAYTSEGRQLADQVEGFKMFLKTAEEHRFNTMNPPEMTMQIFEKYLPYAIALECENAWAAKFETIISKATEQGYQPNYFYGSGYNMSTSSFTSGMASGLAGTISSASTPPSSSGGGSGGGGSSGGGGGGGGGGGW